MAFQARVNSRQAVTASAAALRILAVLLGLFFLAQGLNKLAWLGDSSQLSERLDRWAAGGTAAMRWYIDTIAMPGVPLFARLVPLGEMAVGVALMIGFWPRLFAALAAIMVANFHFASGALRSLDFLRDGAGLPVLGGLLALAIGGSRLPWSVRRS